MTIEEIKEEYAKEQGKDSWILFINYEPAVLADFHYTQVCKRYAKARVKAKSEERFDKLIKHFEDLIDSSLSLRDTAYLNSVLAVIQTHKESITETPLE